MNTNVLKGMEAAVMPEATPLATGEAKRPVVPLRENSPAHPITQRYVDFERAFGDLPLRFLREARRLANDLGCLEEWSLVEDSNDRILNGDIR